MLIGRILITIMLVVGLSGCSNEFFNPKPTDPPPTPPPVVDVVPVPDVPPVIPVPPVLPEPEPVVPPVPDPEPVPEPEPLEPVKVPVKFKGGLTAPTPMGCREGENVDC